MSKGIAALADQVKRSGRHGDTELVHMNPLEIAALEMMSGRKATVNPSTGQKEGFAFLIPLIMAAIGAGTSIASAKMQSNATKDAAAKQEEAMKSMQEADRRRAEQYAKDFVNIPTVQRIQSPAPAPGTYTPGVDPERMQIRDQITGYMRPGYAAGGMMPEQSQQALTSDTAQKVVVEAIAALQGKHPRPQQALQAFVEMFGMDELEALEKELQGGDVGLLDGEGSGMEDKIPANVGGQREVRLSDGEYVVPADVVAHLGDGSTKAGAGQLEGMISRVRQTKTGKTQQPGKLNPASILPR